MSAAAAAAAIAPDARRKKSPNPIVHQHIHPKYLPNLHTYKYSGSDASIVGNYIMQHWWSNVVKLVPKSVAPNALTLAGFFVSLSSTLLVAFYMFFNDGVYPPFVWYYAAVALFAYQTLDAMDGKQARRTYSSSPMGELFDHGCDAFFTPMLQFNICAAMGFQGKTAFYFFVLICSGLFFTIWEQFSTTTLAMGYINGPTDGLLITCVVFALTGAHSTTWWAEPFAAPFELALGGPLTLRFECLRDVLLVFTVISAALTILTNFVHVLTHESSRGLGVAAKAVVPPVVALISMAAVVEHFPEVLLPIPYVLEVTYGLLFSYTATRMTVARLCNMPFNPFSFFFGFTVLLNAAPFVATRAAGLDRAVVVHWFPFVAAALLVFAVWQYLHMMGSVFAQISAFLGINVLTLTEKQKKRIIEEDAKRK